jgi:hypothetical protein
MNARSALAGLGDGLNPVLVREVRASLRNRRFHVAYAFALTAALATVYASVAFGAPRADAGEAVFAALFVCFALTTTVVFTLDVYSRLVSNVSDAAEQLAQMTHLTAGRSVCGRLESALVTLCLYLAAFVPFSTFAYLLHGLEWWVLVQGWVFVAIAGLVAASFAVFVATAVPRGLGSTLLLLAGVSAGASASVCGLDTVGAIWPLHLAAARILLAVSASWLMVSIAGARLALAAENRETGVRVALIVLALAMTVEALVSTDALVMQPDFVWSKTLRNLSVWSLAGCLVLAASDPAPKVAPRWLPRRVFPDIVLLPGRAGAFLLFVASALVMALPLLVAADAPGYAWHDAVAGLAGPISLACVPSALFGWTLARWGFPRRQLAAAGVALVVIVLLVYGAAGAGAIDDVASAAAWSHLAPVQLLVFAVGCLRQVQGLAGLFVALPAGGIAAAYYAPLVMRAVADMRGRAAHRARIEQRIRDRAGKGKRAIRSRAARRGA